MFGESKINPLQTVVAMECGYIHLYHNTRGFAITSITLCESNSKTHYITNGQMRTLEVIQMSSHTSSPTRNIFRALTDPTTNI